MKDVEFWLNNENNITLSNTKTDTKKMDNTIFFSLKKGNITSFFL